MGLLLKQGLGSRAKLHLKSRSKRTTKDSHNAGLRSESPRASPSAIPKTFLPFCDPNIIWASTTLISWEQNGRALRDITRDCTFEAKPYSSLVATFRCISSCSLLTCCRVICQGSQIVSNIPSSNRPGGPHV